MSVEEKIEIDLEAMYPGSTITHADPGPVIFLNRGTDRATELEPVDLEQARREFEIIWSWDHGWTEEMERASQGLLDRGVYRLTMNGSPDEAVDHLDAYLETLK
jgi:hypothetical protein